MSSVRSQTEVSSSSSSKSKMSQVSSIQIPTSSSSGAIPSLARKNSLIATLGDYELRTFTVQVQRAFQNATSQSVNVYCKANSGLCYNVWLNRKRQQVVTTVQDDIRLYDINNNENGVVQLCFYASLEKGRAVLPIDALEAAVRSGISNGYYSGKGFYSISVRRKEPDDTTDMPTLPTSTLLVIIFASVSFVFLLLIVITVIITGYVVRRRRHRNREYPVHATQEAFLGQIEEDKDIKTPPRDNVDEAAKVETQGGTRVASSPAIPEVDVEREVCTEPTSSDEEVSASLHKRPLQREVQSRQDPVLSKNVLGSVQEEHPEHASVKCSGGTSPVAESASVQSSVSSTSLSETKYKIHSSNSEEQSRPSIVVPASDVSTPHESTSMGDSDHPCQEGTVRPEEEQSTVKPKTEEQPEKALNIKTRKQRAKKRRKVQSKERECETSFFGSSTEMDSGNKIVSKTKGSVVSGEAADSLGNSPESAQDSRSMSLKKEQEHTKSMKISPKRSSPLEQSFEREHSPLFAQETKPQTSSMAVESPKDPKVTSTSIAMSSQLASSKGGNFSQPDPKNIPIQSEKPQESEATSRPTPSTPEVLEQQVSRTAKGMSGSDWRVVGERPQSHSMCKPKSTSKKKLEPEHAATSIASTETLPTRAKSGSQLSLNTVETSSVYSLASQSSRTLFTPRRSKTLKRYQLQDQRQSSPDEVVLIGVKPFVSDSDDVREHLERDNLTRGQKESRIARSPDLPDTVSIHSMSSTTRDHPQIMYKPRRSKPRRSQVSSSWTSEILKQDRTEQTRNETPSIVDPQPLQERVQVEAAKETSSLTKEILKHDKTKQTRNETRVVDPQTIQKRVQAEAAKHPREFSQKAISYQVPEAATRSGKSPKHDQLSLQGRSSSSTSLVSSLADTESVYSMASTINQPRTMYRPKTSKRSRKSHRTPTHEMSKSSPRSSLEESSGPISTASSSSTGQQKGTEPKFTAEAADAAPMEMPFSTQTKTMYRPKRSRARPKATVEDNLSLTTKEGKVDEGDESSNEMTSIGHHSSGSHVPTSSRVQPTLAAKDQRSSKKINESSL